MKNKRLKKEDMSVVAISIVVDIAMAISSATSKSEETGEPLSFSQWFAVNLFIVAITAVIDIAIIKKRERKRKELEETERMNAKRIERAQREMSVTVNIKSGGLGYIGTFELHQIFENNLFYIGEDSETLYEMVGYEWDGAKYRKVTKSDSEETETGKKKAGGIGIGGYGTIAATGKVDSTSNRKLTGEVTESEIEEQGSAIIRMKRVFDGRTVSFIIECDSEIDKKIRCFNNILNDKSKNGQ